MAKYRISYQAREDLIRIHQYGVYKFGESQTDKYFNQFFEYFEIIAKNPTPFESVDLIEPGYHHCVCGVESIFYRVRNNDVEIMAIIGKQDISLIL
ncbi:MAG: type II toxin-antitoxin system RelE/ParE family toxin [bacterium]|nr:type II toxin-antitoxin system RelE/ParE family toxin [bacterium]